MVIDEATADYEAEQQKREQRADDRALERSLAEAAQSPTPTPPPSPVCAQCTNWQAERWVHPTDGTSRLRPGNCAVRAAADLPQMSQDYAKQCQFYEEYIPF